MEIGHSETTAEVLDRSSLGVPLSVSVQVLSAIAVQEYCPDGRNLCVDPGGCGGDGQPSCERKDPNFPV